MRTGVALCRARSSLQEIETAHVRKRHVEDDGVVVAPERQLEPLPAVRCAIYGEPELLQPLSDTVQELRVIFDDEHSHAVPGQSGESHDTPALIRV